MTEETITPDVQPEAGEQPVEAPKADAKTDYLKMLPQEIQDKINEIKAKGVKVYMTFLGDSGYVFRTLNVMEWMKLQKAQEDRAKAEGATEEYLQQVFFETLVVATSLGIVWSNDDGVETLAPPISRDSIRAQPAGVPQSLAQQVMFQSGFDNQPMTVKL